MDKVYQSEVNRLYPSILIAIGLCMMIVQTIMGKYSVAIMSSIFILIGVLWLSMKQTLVISDNGLEINSNNKTKHKLTWEDIVSIGTGWDRLGPSLSIRYKGITNKTKLIHISGLLWDQVEIMHSLKQMLPKDKMNEYALKYYEFNR